jgi:hypothetical protein
MVEDEITVPRTSARGAPPTESAIVLHTRKNSGWLASTRLWLNVESRL